MNGSRVESRLAIVEHYHVEQPRSKSMLKSMCSFILLIFVKFHFLTFLNKNLNIEESAFDLQLRWPQWLTVIVNLLVLGSTVTANHDMSTWMDYKHVGLVEHILEVSVDDLTGRSQTGPGAGHTNQ